MKNFNKIAAIALSAVLAGTTLSLAACGENSEAPGETEQTQNNDVTDVNKQYSKSLSSASYNFDAEYFYSDFNALSNNDTTRQNGVDTFENKDIVFQNIYYDQLLYLLNQEGYYLILFGGSWCHNTRAAVPYINEYAKAFGINTVYTFDFRLDGSTENANAHIRESAKTPEYGGESNGKAAADWNYLYGELVSRYLTNLNDWVEYKQDGASALTWYDVNYEPHTVAKAQVPFFFLYNKDNTTHYVPEYDGEGIANHNQTGVSETAGEEGKTYPIVYGFEEMVDRDDAGVYYGSASASPRNYITEDYKSRVKSVFDFILTENIKVGTYTYAQYLTDAFEAGNGRGHAPKLYDIFEDGEQININVITYRQLEWLLQQEGSAIILFGGAWCANTTAGIKPINDYAVANNLTVYMWDTRLDGKYPIDFWGYGRDRQFQTRGTTQEGKDEGHGYGGAVNPFAYLYVDLLNTYLPNIETLNNPTSASFSDGSKVVSYTDSDNVTHSAAKAQVPYIFSYNKDAKDEDGFTAPILEWYEEMLEVNNSASKFTKELYLYTEANYARYTNGVYEVIKAYAKTTGEAAVEYTGAPAHPFVNFDLL